MVGKCEDYGKLDDGEYCESWDPDLLVRIKPRPLEPVIASSNALNANLLIETLDLISTPMAG